MSSEVIQCPACSHPVRVPESLLGQAVRCPKCKAYFTAPTRDVDGFLGTPELLSEPPVRPSADSSRTQKPMSASPMFVPALMLLIVGLTGTIVNGYHAMQWLIDKDATAKDRHHRLEEVAKLTKHDISEDQAKIIVEAQQPTEVAVAIVGLLPIFGAIAMLRMRYWWLAVLGSGVAMINFGNCCCLIGLPSGVYCMIKLLDPQIRAMFQRARYSDTNQTDDLNRER